MIGSSGSRISSVCLASHSCRTGAWTAGIIGVAAGASVAVAVCAAALLGETAAVPTNPALAASTMRLEIGAAPKVLAHDLTDCHNPLLPNKQFRSIHRPPARIPAPMGRL